MFSKTCHVADTYVAQQTNVRFLEKPRRGLNKSNKLEVAAEVSFAKKKLWDGNKKLKKLN